MGGLLEREREMYDVIVFDAGQAGLAMGYFLKKEKPFLSASRSIK